MATYIFYNYQFTRIVRSNNDWTAGECGEPIDPEESFRCRQDIFEKLFREDYERQSPFNFINERKTKTFPHRYLFRPADGMVVMRIGNGRPYKAENEQLHQVLRMDFPSCVVVVDNRPGVQCILIQKRHKAFADVKQLEAILTTTLNGLLRPYKLGFRLDRLHTRDAFWGVVNDKRRYPDGFRWMKCYLPPINLDRLSAVLSRHLADPRKRLGSDMTCASAHPTVAG